MAVDTVTINIDTVEKDLWDKIVAAGNSAQLPKVTSTDNGDLLGVSGGKWAKVDPPAAELPAVTADDNGDLLGVSNGAWAKVTPADYYIDVAVSEDGGVYTATTDAVYADAVAAASAGKNLIAKCSGLASAIVDVPLESVAEDGSYMVFSRVAYLNAILYFKALWTSAGITLTVSSLTVST